MDDSDNGGRKTLLSRFKQIMGERVELIDESTTKPSGKGKGSSGKGEDAPSSSNSKRREQVLQAQRTHRQRTQTYMKMLEKEVIRLREQESTALKKATKLQHQVGVLLATLANNGVPIPQAFHEDPPEDFTDPTGQVTTRTSRDPSAAFIHVEFPEGSMINRPQEARSHGSSSRSQSYSSPEALYGTPTASGGLGYPASISMSAQSSGSNLQQPQVPFLGIGTGTGSGPPLPPSQMHTTEESHHHHRGHPPVVGEDFISNPLQDPRVGIDFVLALERPCMHHIRGTHLDHPDQSIEEEEEGNEVSGHIFAACLSLWQGAVGPEKGREASYEVSKSEIERLLKFSLELGLDQGCEVTPVQIWKRVGGLRVRGGGDEAVALRGLVEELARHVVCLHFGAVLDRFVVEPILDRYFIQPPAVPTVAVS